MLICRLSKQHDGYHQQPIHNQKLLQSCLSWEHINIIVKSINPTSHQFFIHFCLLKENHVDEGNEEVWCTVFTVLSIMVSSIQCPLDKYHQDQVAKQTQEKEQLWQKLEDNFIILSLENLIPQAQHYTKGHVHNTKDERDFHLVSIEESNLVICCLPCWVNAKDIWSST